MIDEKRPSGSLAENPKDILDKIQYMKSRNKSVYKDKVRNGKKKQSKDVASKIKKIKQTKMPKMNKILYTEYHNDSKFESNMTSDEHEHWSYGRNLSYLSQEDSVNRSEYTRNQWVSLKNFQFSPYLEHNHLSSDGFFCGVPSKIITTVKPRLFYLYILDILFCFLSGAEYAHLVFKTNDGSSLLSVENLQSMCILQQQLIDIGGHVYVSLCEHRDARSSSTDCCQPWSLPNYIALLTNNTSCMDITVRNSFFALSLNYFEFYLTSMNIFDCRMII